MASLMLPAPGSRSKVLRHLQHIKPLKKKMGGKFAKMAPIDKNGAFVQPHDRVAYWNIAPGDEVRVRVGGARVTDADGTERTVPYEGIVDTVDRQRNVAWLRPPEGSDETLIPRNIKHVEPHYREPEKGLEGGFGPNVAYAPRPIQYSNLQLKLPKDLKLPSDIKLDLKKGVYANRLVRGTVGYDKARGHFVWRRFAVVRTDEGTLKIEVPWNKGAERSRTRKDNTTLSYVIDNETWRPWNPERTTWLLPFKKPTSPHALERHQRSMAQRALAMAELGAGPDGRMTLATAAARAAARASVQLSSTLNPAGIAGTSAANAKNSSSSSSSLSPTGTSINIAASMLPGSSTTPGGLPVYEGFVRQLLKKVKKPQLPQPASAAEQLWMAKHDMQEWHALAMSSAKQASLIDQDGDDAQEMFSAFDYLDVAPLEGGATAVGTTSGESVNAKPRRHLSDGRLVLQGDGNGSSSARVSKDQLDSWPIELMMKNDLMNENGTKHRRLRWQARQVETKAIQSVIDAKERENLAFFRSLNLRKSLPSDRSTSSAAETKQPLSS